jgi:hypothetical protein
LPLARKDEPNLELHFMRSDSRRVRSEKRRQRLRMKLGDGNEFTEVRAALNFFVSISWNDDITAING